MKKKFILFGMLLKTVVFSNKTIVHCKDVSGRDINTLPKGYIYSKFTNIQKHPSFPKVIKNIPLDQDLFFKNIKFQAQHFDYHLNTTLLSNYSSSYLNLNYSIDFNDSMINKPYKIHFSIFIYALNKDENRLVYLVDHCIKDIYHPTIEDKHKIIFKPLQISISLKFLKKFLKRENFIEDSNQSNCQLILVPYIVNQPDCFGKLIIQCNGQYEDEETNQMPYFHFE